VWELMGERVKLPLLIWYANSTNVWLDRCSATMVVYDSVSQTFSTVCKCKNCMSLLWS